MTNPDRAWFVVKLIGLFYIVGGVTGIVAAVYWSFHSTGFNAYSYYALHLPASGLFLVTCLIGWGMLCRRKMALALAVLPQLAVVAGVVSPSHTYLGHLGVAPFLMITSEGLKFILLYGSYLRVGSPHNQSGKTTVFINLLALVTIPLLIALSRHLRTRQDKPVV